MSICCCSLAGTAACQHCSNNPFATDVWTNRTVTVDHIEARPFGDGLDVCPVCGKPSTIGKPTTNADRIRSMTDEELAEFLDRWELGDIDYSKTFCDLCEGQYDCHDDCLMDWLKEDVKDV